MIDRQFSVTKTVYNSVKYTQPPIECAQASQNGVFSSQSLHNIWPKNPKLITVKKYHEDGKIYLTKLKTTVKNNMITVKNIIILKETGFPVSDYFFNILDTTIDLYEMGI